MCNLYCMNFTRRSNKRRLAGIIWRVNCSAMFNQQHLGDFHMSHFRSPKERPAVLICCIDFSVKTQQEPDDILIPAAGSPKERGLAMIIRHVNVSAAFQQQL